MEIEKEIKNFLKEWEKEGVYCEDVYYRYLKDEAREFETELEDLLARLEVTYDFTCVGSYVAFDYDLCCNCLTVLDSGKILSFPINFEYVG